MSVLNVSNTFVDGNNPVTNPVGTELQENFNNVRDVLNGNLDESNISNDTELDVQKIETTDLLCAENIKYDEIENEVAINLENVVGSKMVIKNSNLVTLFEIDSTGKIIVGI